MEKRFNGRQAGLFVILFLLIVFFSGIQPSFEFLENGERTFALEFENLPNLLLSKIYFNLEKQIEFQIPVVRSSPQRLLDTSCVNFPDGPISAYDFAECSGELNIVFEDNILLATVSNLKRIKDICDYFPKSPLCDRRKFLLQPVTICFDEWNECDADCGALYVDGTDHFVACERQCLVDYQNCVTGGNSGCLGGAVTCGPGESCLQGEISPGCCLAKTPNGDVHTEQDSYQYYKYMGGTGCVNPAEHCASWGGVLCGGGTEGCLIPGGIGYPGTEFHCCYTPNPDISELGCLSEHNEQDSDYPIIFPTMPTFSRYKSVYRCQSEPFGHLESPPLEDDFLLQPPPPTPKKPSQPIWIPDDSDDEIYCRWERSCSVS